MLFLLGLTIAYEVFLKYNLVENYMHCYQTMWVHTPDQGLSHDFHNRVSKLGFQELRLSKIHD